MSIDSNNETTLQIPVNSEVFDYLKDLLSNLKPNDVDLKQGLHFFATGVGEDGVTNVIQSLVSVAPHFIKFPQEGELLEVQQKFYDLSQSGNAEFGFPNVIGVLDCFQVRFQPVDKHGMEIYLNANSEYSINVQLVCGPDLRVYNVLAAFPGSFQDVEIWENSKLCQQLKQCHDNTCWLIGGTKYYQEPNLMTPINNPETLPDQLYNDAHTAVYKQIKYCINMLQTRFKCLHSVLNCNPDNVCAVIIACCVLHNICISCNDSIEINTTEIDSHLQVNRVNCSEINENDKLSENENK